MRGVLFRPFHPSRKTGKNGNFPAPGRQGQKAKTQSKKHAACGVSKMIKGAQKLAAMHAEQPCHHQHKRLRSGTPPRPMCDTYSKVQPAKIRVLCVNPPTVGTRGINKRRPPDYRENAKEIEVSKRHACRWYYTEPSRRRASTASRS